MGQCVWKFSGMRKWMGEVIEDDGKDVPTTKARRKSSTQLPSVEHTEEDGALRNDGCQVQFCILEPQG